MKKYIKPTLEVENYELGNVIAALSTNAQTTLHETVDVYNWDEFWG